MGGTLQLQLCCAAKQTLLTLELKLMWQGDHIKSTQIILLLPLPASLLTIDKNFSNWYSPPSVFKAGTLKQQMCHGETIPKLFSMLCKHRIRTCLFSSQRLFSAKNKARDGEKKKCFPPDYHGRHEPVVQEVTVPAVV